MSIRKNRGVILLASALSLGLMCGLTVSCNENKPQVDENDPWKDFVEDDSITGLQVKNIADLQAAWVAGEADRTMSLSVTPEANITSLIQQKKIMAVSSDSKVVNVLGNKLQAVKGGEATITVRAGKQKVEFKLTITAVKEYKPGDEETLANIIDLPQNYSMYYKTEGVILGWKTGSDGTEYGNFYVATEWDKNAANILVYGATGLESTATADESGNPVLSEKDGTYTFTNPKDWKTNEKTKDLKVGDKISFYCLRLDYNTTKELYAWNVNFVEHKDFPATPEPESVAVNSLSEVMAADLGVVANTLYTGKAKVTEITKNSDYGSLKVADLDGQNETIVYGSTASTGAIVWDGVNEKYTFSNPKDFLTNEVTSKLVVGDIISFRAIRSDYVKNNQKQILIEITKVEEGEKVAPTAITISSEKSSVQVGGSLTLTVATTPETINVPLTWTSSDEAVATVADGVVTGVAVGTAKIKASYNDVVSNEFEVTITEAKEYTPGEEETLANIIELPASNKMYYKTEGVITGWKSGTDGGTYGNLYVSTDWSKNASSILIYGATALGDATVLSENDGTYTFNNPKDWTTNEVTKDLKIGDKISFYCMRNDHNSDKQLYAWNVSFVEHKEVEPDSVAVSSLSEVLAAEVDSAVDTIYTGKAKVSYIKPDDKYGNLKITDLDGENETTVYGSTASTGAISWNGEKYIYSNLKDFLTNDLTSKLVVGDTIAYKAIRADYNGSKQVSIEITAVNPSEEAVVSTYDFSSNTDTGGFTDNDCAAALEFIKDFKKDGGDIISSVTAIEKAYHGYTGYTQLGLKFGTSKVPGKISFTINDSSVTKMRIKGIGWKNSDKITVGETSYTSSAAYTDVTVDTLDTYDFDIDASKEITIELNIRYFITSISFIK